MTAERFDWKQTSGIGLYPVYMAAKLINEKPRLLRSWIDGYPNSDADPIIRRQLPQIGGKTVFGFLDLIEARFIKHFMDLGLSPQAIRKVAAKLRERHNEDHPFATQKRFRTDGRKIFMEVVETDEERKILDIMTDNFVMPRMIEQSLFDAILYADDLAYRWRPFHTSPLIILDPKIAFGHPVIDKKWASTRAIYKSFVAEPDEAETADEFGVSAEAVRQAVAFERSLAESLVH